MKNHLITLLLFFLPPFLILNPGENNIDKQCEYWVAPRPSGDDANPGTSDKPWATLQHAGDHVADENCTVWFKPGIYQGSSRLNRRFETLTSFKSQVPYQAILENSGGVILISGGTNIIFEGFNVRHSGPGAKPLVIAIDGSKRGWSENITLRNNIIHDSYNDDLLKIYNGCKDILVENNLFFNQGDSEEHMDVNSVVNVIIQDNIFFNSFESSGRLNTNMSKQYIVIKDSGGERDGLVGSEMVFVRRNVFLNWEGQATETFVQVGIDGKPYHEARDVYIRNNLFIGNSGHQIGSAFGVRGAKDVFFINNTIVGDLPANSYAFYVTTTEENPKNENIYFVNNIWSDPTGTMGADLKGNENEFSDGHPENTDNLVLINNLYWNGGAEIPDGDLVTPVEADPMMIVQDPMLETNHENIVLPIWNGEKFNSGKTSIREEFLRLIYLYGRVPQASPVVDNGDPSFASKEDILAHPRSSPAYIGAFGYIVKVMKDTKGRIFADGS